MNDGYPMNFRPAEFLCKCKGQYCKGSPKDVSATRHLAWVLQQIRDLANRPMTINSAYRCEKWNKKVGGKPDSEHLKGRAADVVCDGVYPGDLADMIQDLIDARRIPNGGLGRYETFTHYDIRETPARWRG